MSASKSRLGKHNDRTFSQPLGVEFVDYSLKITEETYLRSSEKTSYNPFSLRSSKENVPGDNNPIMSEPHIRKKTRRSMLGQRTKFQNMDSLLNRSKNLACNGSDRIKNEFALGTPNEKNMMKPLFSSSPRSDAGSPNRLYKPEPVRSITPPNPFGSAEITSKFFESDIFNMDNAWSVFKSKQNGLKSPGASSNFGSKERLTVPDPVQNKKSFKTKLFNESNQKTGQSSMSGCKKNLRSNANSSKVSSCSKIRASSVPRMKSPKFLSQYSDGTTSDDNEYNLLSYASDGEEPEHINSSEFPKEEDEDSFAEHESTIRAVYNQGSSSKPKLSVIREEDVRNPGKEMYASLINDSDKSSSNSQEETSGEDADDVKKDFEQLKLKCSAIEKRVNTIDKLFENLFEEKNLFKTELQSLNKLIDDLNTKIDNQESQNNMNTNNSCKLRKKQVNLTKVKQNAVSMLSPENILKTPCNIKAKPRKSQYLKSYSELRQNFSYLKTPDLKSTKKPNVRRSTCYTPNSLSICVAEQLKGLDSGS